MAKHHKKATGGPASGDGPGRKDYEADVKDKPYRYTQGKAEDEAEEKKRGGRARRKRKHGGKIKHHESRGGMAHLDHAKHIGPVKGGHAKANKGKAARGGSNFNPLSSAHAGTKPSGHKDMEID